MTTERTPYIRILSKLMGKTHRATYQWFKRKGMDPSNRMDAMEYFKVFSKAPKMRCAKHYSLVGEPYSKTFDWFRKQNLPHPTFLQWKECRDTCKQ